MAKPVLFVIHGIGKHEDGWASEVREKISEIGGRYPSVEGDLAEQYDWAEINYDPVFVGELERLEERAEEIRQSGLLPHYDEALGWLEGASEDDFAWTHVADAVLYLAGAVRNAAVAGVAAAMAEKMQQTFETAPGYHILAHSLGTSVAVEATALLARPIPARDWPGLPEGFRFGEVLMLANVSRLFQRDTAKAYLSPLLPSPVPVGRRAQNYWNYAHEVDPIPRVRRFDFLTAASTGYRSYTLTHFYERNLHSFLHYLEHPLVHGPIVRIPRKKNLHPTTWKMASDRYFDDAQKRFGGDFQQVADALALRRELEERRPDHPDDRSRLLANLKLALDTLKEVMS